MFIDVYNFDNWGTYPADNSHYYGYMSEQAPNAWGSRTSFSGWTGVLENTAVEWYLRLPATWTIYLTVSGDCADNEPDFSKPMVNDGTARVECPLYGYIPSLSTFDTNGIPLGDPSLLYGHDLVSNGYMYPNDAIVSPGGDYTLLFQHDGNLVLYDESYVIAWESETDGAGPGFTVMASDGNLIVYDDGSSPAWSSGTSTAGSCAAVQDDGQVVIYPACNSGNTPTWSSAW